MDQSCFERRFSPELHDSISRVEATQKRRTEREGRLNGLMAHTVDPAVEALTTALGRIGIARSEPNQDQDKVQRLVAVLFTPKTWPTRIQRIEICVDGWPADQNSIEITIAATGEFEKQVNKKWLASNDQHGDDFATTFASNLTGIVNACLLAIAKA
jgi:hypothetical protein